MVFLDVGTGETGVEPVLYRVLDGEYVPFLGALVNEADGAVTYVVEVTEDVNGKPVL